MLLGEKLVGASAFLQKRHVHSTDGGGAATELANLTAALLARQLLAAAASSAAFLTPSSVKLAGFSVLGPHHPPSRPRAQSRRASTLTLPERPLSSGLPTSE